MGGLLNEGIEALFPASEAEGNIVSITRRGRHRPSAFGVSFLRCDVTFSTLHHITHEKPKPPAIEEKYPHTFLFVMRNCHSEAQWGSDLNSYITNRRELKLATDSEPHLTGQARRSDLPPTPLKIKNSRSADHSVRSADQLWRRQRLGSGRIGKI